MFNGNSFQFSVFNSYLFSTPERFKRLSVRRHPTLPLVKGLTAQHTKVWTFFSPLTFDWTKGSTSWIYKAACYSISRTTFWLFPTTWERRGERLHWGVLTHRWWPACVGLRPRWAVAGWCCCTWWAPVLSHSAGSPAASCGEGGTARSRRVLQRSETTTVRTELRATPLFFSCRCFHCHFVC